MKLIIVCCGTNYEFSDNVFAEPPKLKEEIEITEPKATAQMNSIKFKVLEPIETGNEIEQLNWLLTSNLESIEKLRLLKDNGVLLTEGSIDLEGEIVVSNVEQSISIPIIDLMAALLDTTGEVFDSFSKTLYEHVEAIHEGFFVPAGITNISLPTEELWLTVRPLDINYPGYVYIDRKYKLLYNDLKLKEILKQICILGNCRIFIRDNTLQVVLNDNIADELITPDGDLEELSTKTELLTRGYELSGSMCFYTEKCLEASSYAITPQTSPCGISSGSYGAVWQDENGNQWELYSVRDVSGQDEDREDRLEFHPSPDNPPVEPGYVMPGSGWLTHVSGGDDPGDIEIKESIDIYEYYLLETTAAKAVVDEFYRVGERVKYHNLEGLNGNLMVGDFFDFNNIIMRAIAIERDMSLIENPLQAVKIKALRRI